MISQNIFLRKAINCCLVLLLCCLNLTSFSQYSRCYDGVGFDMTCNSNSGELKIWVHNGSFSSTVVNVELFFGPNNPSNGEYVSTLPNNTQGQFSPLTISGIDCNYANNSENVQILYSDYTSDWCTIVNRNVCYGCDLPLGDFGASVTSCSDVTEGCDNTLDYLIQENLDDLMCNQWNGCNTTSQIDRLGSVAIGTEQGSDLFKLTVTQGIITDHVKIEFCKDGGWCDYVFEEDYKLTSLKEVEKHISEKGHLHKTRSASEIEGEGYFEIKAVTLDHQEKIEEIFLHLIALKSDADDLQTKLEKLKYENKNLKKAIAANK